MTSPLVSVIVPTRDRPRALEACLTALAAQQGPDFEVLVVDDGGDAPLEPGLEAVLGRLRVQLLRQTNAGPSAARNLGLRQARGRFVAFTDDDCRPRPDWLSRVLPLLEVPHAVLVGGRTLNGLPANARSEASQLVCDLAYAHYNADAARPRFFAANNIACERKTLISIGGFDPAFRTAEDRELCDRWLAAGHATAFAPEAVVVHEHALSLSGFCRQHFNYGRGARLFHRRQARRRTGSLWTHAAFHGRLLALLWPRLLKDGFRRGLALSALLALWEGVNAAGYLRETLRAAPQPPEPSLEPV